MSADDKNADERPIDARVMAIYDDLTASERRLASVILEAQSNLSSFTAGELAARAGISKATAARFFRRLGYQSYKDARMQARQSDGWGSPLYELTGTGKQRLGPNGFGLHVAQDLQNLTRTAEILKEETVAEAVDALASARRVWIIGFRNSMALATYARGLLVHVKPDVHLLPLAGMSIGEDLAGLVAEDVLLIIGFRRRPPILREAMAVAVECGTRSVLVTDTTAARTAQLATVVLRCHNRGYSLFDSYAAPISVINYLCSAVGQALGEDALDRLARIEALHARLEPLTSQRRPKRQPAK